ncbi:MAG TPA: haloacid dehalogenase-like hydrolase, partial [Acidimicrobiia bacterium]|nr:haloacid dehalogenase-like hydrolase [Acidimicrobiia bacterium]
MSTRAFVPRGEAGAGDALPGDRLALFDLDRTLLPGSSLMVLGRALHRAGLVGGRTMLSYLARDTAFARRGEGGDTARRLLAALLTAVAGHEAAPILAVAENLGEDLTRAVHPTARWLLEQHVDAGDFCVVVSASPQELVEVATRA